MEKEIRAQLANAAQGSGLEVTRPSKLRVLASRVDGGLIILLALPWLMLSARVPWILSGVGKGLVDPDFYFGFFLDLSTHFRILPPTYFGSRLSWILPGYAAFKLFSPLAAAYVLHLSFYYAATFSNYLILKQTVGQRAALVSTIFMGSYCYFLWAMGANYVDGAGIAYFLLTILALTYAAAHPGWPFWLALGGATYGAMIYSNLFLMVFTLPLLVYHLFVNREYGRRPLWSSLWFLILGFLAASVVLAAINYRLNGDFLFWMPSLRFAASSLPQPNPYRLSVNLWIDKAVWLVFPTGAFFSSLAFLFLGRALKSDNTGRLQILFQVHFLLCALIFLAFQTTGRPVLQVFLYAGYLMPSSFLAIGAQLAPQLNRLSSQHFVLLALGLLTILLSAYVLAVTETQTEQWLVHHIRWLVGLILAVEIILLVRRISRRTWALLVLIVTLGLLYVVNGAARNIFDWQDLSTEKNRFLAVVEGLRAIQGIHPGENLLFWYNLDEPGGALYRSIASTYLWNYWLINESFPSLAKGRYSSGSPKLFGRIAILSNQRDAFEQADEALRKVGFRARLIGERSFQQGPLKWKITLIQVRNDPPQDDLRLTADGWPESLRLPWQPQKGRALSFRHDARPLFSSDLDITDGWEINRYGQSGGLKIEPDGLAKGDRCGVYSSGEIRDHLASRFVERVSRPGLIFFSVWVKPLQGEVFPIVSLQDERFGSVGESRELSIRPDGWVLMGNWSEVQSQQKIRLLIIQPPGTASLVDKALLVEFPDPAQ